MSFQSHTVTKLSLDSDENVQVDVCSASRLFRYIPFHTECT